VTIVWVWCVIAACGMLVSTALTRSSYLDIVALGERGNGRRLLARSRFAREGIRISVHALDLLAGLFVVFLPPAHPLRGLIIPILVWGNLALLINSAIDYVTRKIIEDRNGG
jgi:hypothetical protein